MTEFSELVGKTLKEVKKIDEEQLRFETVDGEEYVMMHHQDCCEHVYIEDICGDLEDLVGSPIVVAEEVSNSGEFSDGWPDNVPEPEYSDESWTWTFYKLATNKGSVTIRWYGSSNGYYSESVDFEKAA